MEIRSPGLFYGGLTIAAIRKKMVSARRNELLAELFQRSHRIEKWGRGIKMILEREPATEFEEVGTVQFVATFKRKNYEMPADDFLGTTTQKSSEKSSEKILVIIAANPEISARQIAEILGISARGVEKQLDKLRQQGILKRIGPDKGGYWEVVNTPND